MQAKPLKPHVKEPPPPGNAILHSVKVGSGSATDATEDGSFPTAPFSDRFHGPGIVPVLFPAINSKRTGSGRSLPPQYDPILDSHAAGEAGEFSAFSKTVAVIQERLSMARRGKLANSSVRGERTIYLSKKANDEARMDDASPEYITDAMSAATSK